jgi:hypothetical protein
MGVGSWSPDCCYGNVQLSVVNFIYYNGISYNTIAAAEEVYSQVTLEGCV